MAVREKDIFGMREYGMELNQCGINWQKDSEKPAAYDNSAELSQFEYVGDSNLFETSIDGVIGLNGKAKYEGPGILLRDVENLQVDMLWTNGLIGCMGLAILGRDEEGKLDAYFTHAKHYDKENATNNPKNPMYHAKRFVDSHDSIRVFWGTDFFFGKNTTIEKFQGEKDRQKAQQVLSNKLGCWVKMEDCITSRESTFLPKLCLMKKGMPNQVYKYVKKSDKNGNLVIDVQESKNKCLEKFETDSEILFRLKDKLQKIKGKGFLKKHIFQRNKYKYKSMVIADVLCAYEVGNLDALKHCAVFAKHNRAPYGGKSAQAWAPHDNSDTKELVITVCEAANQQILASQRKDAEITTTQPSSTGCSITFVVKKLSDPKPEKLEEDKTILDIDNQEAGVKVVEVTEIRDEVEIAEDELELREGAEELDGKKEERTMRL
jgi:hypothetical protein